MKLKRFEIENQTEYLSKENLNAGLANPAIKKWAYILHDKDVNENGETKAPHYHVLIWLNNAYDSKYVCRWFGVAEQYVQKIRSDVGALEYLTHVNDIDKYQYSDDEVTSNFDIKGAIEVEKAKISSTQRLNDILMQIDTGELREYNLYNYLTIEEFVKYKRQLDAAFSYRTQKLKGAERNMNCIFITGQSGSGKTTYAKQIASDNNMSLYVSSGSNDVLDDYQGQDCIILDDLRPSCLGLSDLLKMLDNNTSSTVKSRYKNKVLECKMIIVTTTQDIDTFFHSVFSEQPESAIQLQRRCETLIKMDTEKICFYQWQRKSQVYSKVMETDNVVIEGYDVGDMTPMQALDKLQNVLGASAKFIEQVKQNPEEYGLPTDGQMKFREITGGAPNPFK